MGIGFVRLYYGGRGGRCDKTSHGTACRLAGRTYLRVLCVASLDIGTCSLGNDYLCGFILVATRLSRLWHGLATDESYFGADFFPPTPFGWH